MTGRLAHWAYAITEGDDGAELSSLTGVAGARVRAAAVTGLTVLVSDVGLAEFGEEALRRNLENPAWLEEAARAHHHVIDTLARMFPLLPLRLATVYRNDVTMAAAIAGRRHDLRAALRRVGGRVEWGVKAYAARERIGVPQAPTRGKGTSAGAEGGRAGTGNAEASVGSGTGGEGAGLAYLKRRRAELSAQRDSAHTAAASARAVHTELSGHAEHARLYPPQAPALSGSRAPMLLNAAYLLHAGGADWFASAVAGAATAHPNLRLELTGPWPPYSFAGEEA